MPYDKEFEVALNNGWTVDKSQMNHCGPKFTKGTVCVWKIRNGWQCADLIDGMYCKHRTYNELINALESE